MNPNPQSIRAVDQSALKQKAYPDDDVLLDPKHRKERQSRLDMAVMYGSTANYKVRLHFRDADGTKSIFGVVCDLRKGQVILNGGVRVPVHRITEVIFP